MALEPAGISLKVEGFSKYINSLNQIDKKHKDIFGVDAKPLVQAYNDVGKAAKKYGAEVGNLDKKTRTASQSSNTLNTALRGLAVGGFTVLLQQLGKGVFELGKLGGAFEAQRLSLANLAASYGQSGTALQQAIVRASRGTISNLKALQVANEGLLLGVARTPEEFERFTEAALTLGRSVGISASEAISRFTTALGRESLLRLDDFGVKAVEVNAELAKLAQQRLGKLPEELSKVERSSLFIEAALKVTGENTDIIGQDAAESARSFDRISTEAENFKVAIGEIVVLLNNALGAANKISEAFKFLTVSAKAFGVLLGDKTVENRIVVVRKQIEELEGDIERFSSRNILGKIAGFLDISGTFIGSEKELGKAKERLEELRQSLKQLELEKAANDLKKIEDNQRGLTDATQISTDALKAFEGALRGAENLQLQFTRQAEDRARNQARDEEDITRRRARESEDLIRRSNRRVSKLNERQANEREDLLTEQQKRLDKFERNRLNRIAEAEAKAAKERKRAAEERVKAQEDLFRRLRQAEERFRLSQLQGERRFLLEDRRLRAEGDILGLQQLREDRALQVQEDKENFDLSQRQTKENAKAEEKERDKEFNAEQRDRADKLKKLKDDLDRQREELLIGFDEQLKAQEKSQADQRAELQRTLAERIEDRKIAIQREDEDRRIALEREEEDRRISQQRQLEDLGRSLANQKDVTEQGVKAIADEIGKIFGEEGVADTIFKGFTERTESDFKDLFDNIEDIVKETEKEVRDKVDPLFLPIITKQSGKIHELPRSIRHPDFTPAPPPTKGFGFNEGGVVPGPIGSPQIIQAHGGETVLPTHKQSFTMNAPIIPAQSLNVNMSGGFDISGGDQAGPEAVQAAIDEMTSSMEIAIKRIARRN